MHPLLRFYLLFAWLILPAWGKGIEGATAVGSFTVVDEWIGRLSGEELKHYALIPSGGELHGYTLSAQDARKLSQAVLIVGINPQLEPWLADWAKANQREADLLWLHPEPLPSGSHLWIIPDEVAKMLSKLAKRMETMGVENSQNNLNQQLKEVNAVKKDLQEAFALLPPARRTFISQHQGLEGYAAAVGLKVAGSLLESASAESADPSARRYADLLKVIREEKVRVITVDEGQNHAFAERLSKDAGLPPPVPLCFEYLAKPGTPGDTWASMMRLNSRKLAEALARP